MSSSQKQYNVPNKPGKPAQSGSPALGTHVFSTSVNATIMSGPFSPDETDPLQRVPRVVCPKCGNEDLRTSAESGLAKCNRCGRTFSIEGGVACMLNDEEQKNDQGTLKGMFTEKK